MKKLSLLTSSLCIALLSSQSYAANLNDIYQQALDNDLELAAAHAQKEATLYQAAEARSALLPQVNLQATYTETNIDKIEGKDSGIDPYDTTVYSASVQQTLFNLNSWYNWRAASAQGDSAELQYALSEQQLILRSAKAYFDVLRAQENLETAQAQEKAVKRQLEQTQQRFDVGLVAITDVHDAEAQYDLSYANLIGQQANLDISKENLQQITNQRFEDLSTLKDDIEYPQPEKSAQEWVDAGMAKYKGIQIALAGMDSAEYARKAGWLNYAPVVNVSWAMQKGDQANMQADPNTGALRSTTFETDTQVLTLQASLPLFAGGRNYAAAKKAAAQEANAAVQLDTQRRNVKNTIRSTYLQLKTAALTIKARKRSTISAQSALDATQTGYKVGTRNIVEVLNAQQNLFSAQRDYANARYDYILSLLQLKFYAGSLSKADVDTLNAWLK